jgi:hypothetical protein
VRKWIRNLDALQSAQPNAKLVQKSRTPTPDLIDDANTSETESVASSQPPARVHSTPRSRRGGGPARAGAATPTMCSSKVLPLFEYEPALFEEMRAARELLSLSGWESEVEA